MTKKKESGPLYCCEPLKFVTTRAKQEDRLGLKFELSFMTGEYILVVNMRKGAKSSGDNWRATYAIVNYCPFCAHIHGKSVKP